MGLFDIFKKKKKTKEVDIDILQQQMYQSIFNKLAKCLPQRWKKVDFHLYHTSKYFGIKYFVLTENNQWLDCFEYLDKQTKDNLFDSIEKEVAKTWNQLPDKHKWCVLNLIVDNQGHIDVNYDYADEVKDDDEKLFSYLFNEEKEWAKKFDKEIK